MSPDHLKKESIAYNLLRVYARFLHNVYYEEVCIVGTENIPVDEPVIFAPNHQNALMDALAVLIYQKKQPVFMARADIFKKPTVKTILTFLKILPVFRIRDGKENLLNNDDTYGVALDVLKAYQPVGIMPEGNHGEQRRLRPLKKGIVRFAIQAQQEFGKRGIVHIVPVGIDYSHYSKLRSKLLVVYGKPIRVDEYLEGYTENQNRTLFDMLERLSEEMAPNMINIDSDTYYDTIYQLKTMFEVEWQVRKGFEANFYGTFKAGKIISDRLVEIAKTQPSEMDGIKAEVDEYTALLKRNKLSAYALETPHPKWNALAFDVLRYLLFLPFFAAASVFHAIPYFTSMHYSQKSKDPQFVSSFRFVLLLLSLFLYYLILLLIPMPIILKIGILVSMPLFGVLSVDYYYGVKELVAKIKFWAMERANHPDAFRVRTLRKVLANKIENYMQS